MAAPRETFKLARGLGRLIRTSPSAPWVWQRWDRHQNKWVTLPTNEVNRSRAEQYAYQQAAIQSGHPNHSRNIRVPFSTVAEDYVIVRREGRGGKRLRESSLLKVEGAIKSFGRFAGKKYATLCVDHVDSALLREFAEKETTRISPTAASRNIHYVLQVLKHAHEQALIAEIPKLNGISHANSDDGNENGVTGSAVPTADQVRRILEAAKVKRVSTDRRTGHNRPVYDGVNKNDYTDLFATICYTGMRINEAIHMTWDDVDFKNKVILIRPGVKNGKFWQPKTKHGIRRIAIVPELEQILRRLRRSNRENAWVFESHRATKLHACNVQKRFREICDALAFERRFTVHSLRKYWASTVAQQGMDWQLMIKAFGHGDFKLILESYYAQNDDARLVQEASRIDFGLEDGVDNRGDADE